MLELFQKTKVKPVPLDFFCMMCTTFAIISDLSCDINTFDPRARLELKYVEKVDGQRIFFQSSFGCSFSFCGKKVRKVFRHLARYSNGNSNEHPPENESREEANCGQERIALRGWDENLFSRENKIMKIFSK